MDANIKAVAQACVEGIANDTMTFPQISLMLAEAGVERILSDLCRGTSINYTPDGESLELSVPWLKNIKVAYTFNAVAIKELIEEGRNALAEGGGLIPGYSYQSFFPRLGAAGCAGSMISFPGRYTVYFGRTGEAHVEPFPPLK